jgi:hypothetical protein
MATDRPLREIAERHHGLCTVERALDHLSHDELRYLVDGVRWDRCTPRVLRLVGAPRSSLQAAMAAVLDAGIGGALSHTSAAAHWRVSGNPIRPFHVTRARDRSNRPGRLAVVHEPIVLPAHHVVVLDDVPVVVPARALIEVAGMQRRGAELEWWVRKIARMVDAAWAMRLVSGVTMRAMIDELAERGRPGIGTIRQVMAERPNSYVPPASGLEGRFAEILRRAGEPPMDRQVDCGDDTRWIGRVDFIDRGLSVIAEIQSERFHASFIDRQLDAERIADLEAAGFRVIEISETDVWHRPTVVVDRIRMARAEARAHHRAA